MMAFPETLPIDGPLRPILLILEILLMLIGFQAALRSFKNYKELQDTIKGSRMHLAWFVLFFAYSFTIFIYIIADFFILDENVRFQGLQYGYITAAIGAFVFVYNIEAIGIINTKRVITIVFSALFVLLIFLFILSQFFGLVDGTLIQYFATIFWIPMTILFLVYTIKLNKLIRGKLKIYSTLLIIGIIIFILGFVGATDFAIENVGIGLYIRIIADLLAIGSIIIMSLFFSLLPSFRELEWKTSLISLFVVYKGGLCVFEHHFNEQREKNENPDGDFSSGTMMVGSVLEMIKSVLNTVLKKGDLKVLDLEDKKILLEQGTKIQVAMVTSEELDSSKFLLNKFLREFESFYGNILENWDGDTSAFEPAKGLITRIFG